MLDFTQLVAAGKRAAKVFSLNMKHFLDVSVVAFRDMQDDDVEGCDFDTVEVCWSQTDLDADTKTLLVKIGLVIDGECLTPQLVRGGTEVKGMQPNQSLHRDDLQDIKCVCLPFGLWSGTKKNANGYRKYSRERHGWLRRLFQPEWMPQSSAEPICLEFILECWDNQGGKRPFASIAFTDFQELKRRLIAYGKENGLDLTNWESIPVGKEADNYTCGTLLFRKNVWFVPLDLLVDIARITIIGDAPRFYKNGRCDVELQEKRYHHLCDNAAAHMPYGVLELEGDLTQPVPDHLMFNLLHLDAVREALRKM